MGNSQSHGRARVLKSRRGFGAQGELDVLDRRDPISLELLVIECRRHPSLPHFEAHELVDPHQAIEFAADAAGLGNLDHQGGRKLMIPGDELVVDRDLLGDGLFTHAALGPGHFLDLKNHRVPVLKNERQPIAQGNPPILLHRNRLSQIPLTNFFVGREVQNFRRFHPFHTDSSPPGPNP